MGAVDTVVVDPSGRAVYPRFSLLRIADLSAGYNASCADRAADIVTTNSVRGTTGAAPTQFDGVFLDDMAMSPAQGQNMRDIGTWGPWGSDDGYGQAMLRTVAAIDDGNDALALGCTHRLDGSEPVAL